MPREPKWDPIFLEFVMDDIKEMIEDAAKSRRKVFEDTYTLTHYGSRAETIVITVKRTRP